MHHASCIMHHASCIMHITHHASCIMHHASCIIHHSSIIIHHATCITYNACSCEASNYKLGCLNKKTDYTIQAFENGESLQRLKDLCQRRATPFRWNRGITGHSPLPKVSDYHTHLLMWETRPRLAKTFNNRPKLDYNSSKGLVTNQSPVNRTV